MKRSTLAAPALLTVVLATVTACSSGSETAAVDAQTITITNCDTDLEFPSPAQRLFVNDGNMISMALALGAQDQVVAVSSMQRDAETLARHYGQDVVDGLNQVAPEYPSRETVLAQDPDTMIAGWNYGYSEDKNLTPDSLRADGIPAYTLTESCRQTDGERARGTVPPWDALRADLTNIGEITGRADTAQDVIADVDERLAALESAPQAQTPPTIFLFDSATDTVYTSGRFGAPQAIIEAAGAVSATADIDDTWVAVSWERIAAANPDAFLFVDYPPQTFAEKIELLRTRPGFADLPAVRDSRFLNLPYALWTSGPLNVDAAEQVRARLEQWQLVPESGIVPKFDDSVPA
ncbi:ABC transporter substrate-binding protein [Millisia brevis]|uniref:ABC transporter substrate-binding protein n=1 Tax=Millisia brevis TaxID=264148 RepID=UPI000836B00C|nr:ABC transporter substrate-binding protein [Millisia brevis]